LVVVCNTIGRGRSLVTLGHDKGRARGYPNLVKAMGRVSFHGGRAGIRRSEKERERVTTRMM
jgi:hypothetical protein